MVILRISLGKIHQMNKGRGAARFKVKGARTKDQYLIPYRGEFSYFVLSDVK